MAQCSIDIFAPSVSTVSKGIEGKLILLHSNERKLGKTAQAVRFFEFIQSYRVIFRLTVFQPFQLTS